MHSRNPGGSFALPLTDEKLVQYSSIVESLSASALKDGLTMCLGACNEWWLQPESTSDGRPHPVGMGTIIDLDEPIKKALDPHIPWPEELDHIQNLCDAIPQSAEDVAYGEASRAWKAGGKVGKAPVPPVTLAVAARSLLWHARELCLDREPITTDKL